MRRSVQTSALAPRIRPDEATFASLPLPLAHRIFLALPPDARGRACCVCRAWRDALADPSLWTRLDVAGVDALEDENFLHWRQRFLAVLRGAAGRAHGQLCQLDLSQQNYVVMDDLLPVLTANAGSLRELHLSTVHGNATVEAVVAAAPLLQVLAAEDAFCTWEDAPQILRAEPPFALLQLRSRLVVHFHDVVDPGGMERVAPFAAALVDAALQPALSHVCVEFVDTAQPALMGALADAVLARRLPELSLEDCTPPAAAPLARLLAEGSLAVFEFSLSGHNPVLFEAAGVQLVADALRANTTLTELELFGSWLHLDMRLVSATLGDALVGHRSLRQLTIYGVNTAEEDCSVFGAALAALIAAEAPALQTLDCSVNELKDAGLAPIMEALPLNRHLRTLDVSDNNMSEAFARERLLPAVRANTTLRELACDDRESWPAAEEAVELVCRRWKHA